MAITPAERKLILAIFTKKFGLTLQKDAIDAIGEVLPSLTAERSEEDVLEFLAKSFEKRDPADGSVESIAESRTIVTKTAIQELIQASFKPSTSGTLANRLSKSAPVTFEVSRSGTTAPSADMDEDYGEGFMHPVDRESVTNVDVLSRAQIAEHFHVIDSFSVPKLRYSWNRKTFEPSPIQASLFAEADVKSGIYRERYDLLRQRLLTNPLFRDASAFENENVREAEGTVVKVKGRHRILLDGTSGPTNHFPHFLRQLTKVHHILTTEGGRFNTFGMLVKMADGRYHLEDPDASIPLEFPMGKVGRTTGMFTETTFVLVEGEWTERGTLRVDMMAMPPGESRAETE
ncbi:DNA-directed DNA polymerase epsilon, subunit B [Gonapodya sp. JEL0774]|nr:DNA-directed DNA polymerase epsilon, subunit B [Gonapodya sp. JEL0774]